MHQFVRAAVLLELPSPRPLNYVMDSAVGWH